MTSVRDEPPPYDAVVFDCDSTLSEIEGIDELAAAAAPAVRAEVLALTRRAMAGEVALEAVYGHRLEILRPTRTALAAVADRYVERCLPNAVECVRALLALEKEVHVVSGGLEPAVRVLADHLGVAPECVHAVPIAFEGEAFAGWGETSPLARAGGKLELLRELGLDARRTALVGDGATDLEAAPACARFVAFGGVERREPVFARARAGTDAADFAAVLALVTDAAELDRLAQLPEHAALARAARAF